MIVVVCIVVEVCLCCILCLVWFVVFVILGFAVCCFGLFRCLCVYDVGRVLFGIALFACCCC